MVKTNAAVIVLPYRMWPPDLAKFKFEFLTLFKLLFYKKSRTVAIIMDVEINMEHIANLLFEVRILKDIVRSGYAFLGSGKETIAEHSFMTAFICFAMARMNPGVNSEKLVAMALVHDIAEARTGDLNYVGKKYCETDEAKAVSHLTRHISFGDEIKALVEEFNLGESEESRLANDADQISFILELKKLMDTGVKGPEKWLPIILGRLMTQTGQRMGEAILKTGWDEWWMHDYSE
jgi:putative hydrolase of HD superfamily